MNLLAIAKLTQIAAAVSSIALARRRAEHVPAAVALVILAAVSLARGPLRGTYASQGEILYYVDAAAELGTAAAVAGLAMAVAVTKDARRRAFALTVAAWAFASIVLGIMSPVSRQQVQRFYFGVDLVCLFVSAAALVRWGQRLTAAKRSPDSASVVALGLVALDGAVLLAPFSPWRGLVFGSDFTGIQVIIAMFFATFTVVQVIAWWFSRGSVSGRA